MGSFRYLSYSRQDRYSVIIVGAGPVGLLTALRLGQAGISTIVLEGHDKLLDTTRAVSYMPVVIPALSSFGFLGRIEEQAYKNTLGAVWRDMEGNVLGVMPLSGDSADEYGGNLLMGQSELSVIILDALKEYSSVKVEFGHRCVGIEQVKDGVKVMVNHDYDDQLLLADYVLGTDGTNSFVRRACCIPFEGYTWQDFQITGADVEYDFEKECGFTPFNYFVDPENWAVIVRTSHKNQWRVAYAESPKLDNSEAEVRARSHKRLEKYMKGSKGYRIIRLAPYRTHQRCAATFRKGRVLLAGDAAHSNNPMGGLGLTGGILDAYTYGNALVRHLKGGESDEILTRCANSRRDTWRNITHPTSVANLLLLYTTDQKSVKEREVFFERLKTDPYFAKSLRKAMYDMLPETFAVGSKSAVSKLQLPYGPDAVPKNSGATAVPQ